MHTYVSLWVWLEKTSGFSLVDAILGTVIISIGLMAGLIIMQNSTLNTLENDHGTMAAHLAKEKIEMMFADDQFKGFDYVVDANNYPNETLDGAYQGFTRKVVVQKVGDDLVTPTEDSGLTKVTVTVSYGLGEIAVSSLIADYE